MSSRDGACGPRTARQVAVDLDERVHRHVVHHADRALLDVEDVVDDLAQVVAVTLGHTEQHRDHRGREDAEKSCT